MAEPKWTKVLRPDMPTAEAARVVVGATFRAVARRLERAARRGRSDAEIVHALRVATRRAVAAVDLLEPSLDAGAVRKARTRLKRIRRAAGAARDGDVHMAEIRKWLGAPGDARRPALEYLGARTARERREAEREVREAAERYPRERIRGTAKDLLRPVRKRGDADGPLPLPGTLLDASRRAIAARAEEFGAAAGRDLSDLDHVHELRLSVKRLRYVMELVAPSVPSGAAASAFQRVQRLQEQLGVLNDRHRAAERLEEIIAEFAGRGGREDGRRRSRAPSLPVRAGIEAIHQRCRQRCERAHGRFLEFWRQTGSSAIADDLRALLAPMPLPEPMGANGAQSALPGPLPREFVRLNGSATTPTGEGAATSAVRIAAIDVGTNTIRLIVAEAQADGSYRVLDDEKEVARLGRGLDSTGELDAGAMEHSATTVARMKAIASGYGVGRLRVVGTCAVREARNRGAFTALVRERAGIDLEVISAEEEAKLAFLSAAATIDLSSGPAAVMDIGGGSTEIVLSAAGVVERVYTVPLGAVRLTERFGGAVACTAGRYKDMREHVKDELRRRIGRPPLVPRVLVGTGGTVTTLASIAIHTELGPAADGLFSGSVQGREVHRWEVKHLLDFLRKMPLRERARVNGLSPDRADIIVAGLVLVAAAMKRLGADRITAHDGGIRDGLLLTMVREMRDEGSLPGGGGPGPERLDPMRSVRRFAKACGYEHRHCTHVGALSLQIFDQLATERMDTVFTPANRAILEAAALIHDVGYLINYSGHHRHSYHLIVHSDLPGWSAREVNIIANLARYHRRADPKPSHGNLARLSKADRELVCALAAILRIADGLDRTHMQRVRAVHIAVAGGEARFDVEADEEPTVDTWGASRKSGLFEAVYGLRPRFEWVRPETPQPEVKVLLPGGVPVA